MKLRKMVLKIILTSMLILTAIAVQAQTAGRLYIEKELDLSYGNIYSISDDDTLRYIDLTVVIPDNYYLYEISISSKGFMNYIRIWSSDVNQPIKGMENNVHEAENYQDTILYYDQCNVCGDTTMFKYKEYYDNIFLLDVHPKVRYQNLFFIKVLNHHSFFLNFRKVHIILKLIKFI